MLQFCKNNMYYMQIEVLAPNYHKLKQQLRKCKTIDEVMEHHSNFLDDCLKQCLLTDKPLFNIIFHMHIRMLFFSRVIIRFFNNVKDEETVDLVRGGDARMYEEDFEYGQTPYELLSPSEQRKYRNKKASELIIRNISENNYPMILDNFEKKFNDFMK